MSNRSASRRTMAARVHAAAAAAILALSAPALPAIAAGAPAKKMPDFITGNTGWTLLGGKYGGKDYQPPPPGAPGAAGPIGDDPDHPHFGNTSGATPTVRMGNAKSPLLTPWAQQQMAKTNAAINAGGVPFDPAARCWPAGVPAAVTFAVEPMYFVPVSDKEVIILYQRGQVVRHIYMDQPHSKNVKPSWYGESVGRIDGDTLVVDTIGLSDKSFVDVFNTPHTDALHVIERYRTIPGVDGKGGKTLEVVMTLEDPGAFTKTWSAEKLLGQTTRPVEESLCQVNNDDVFHQGLKPVPTAAKPDF